LKNKTRPLRTLGKILLLLFGSLLFSVLVLIYFPKTFGEGAWQSVTIYMILLIVIVLLGLGIKKTTKLEWDWDCKSGETIIRRVKTKDEEEGGE